MTEKCGAGYTSAIWGIPRNIVYLCNLPKGHGGYHHGEDEETGTYTNWPDITGSGTMIPAMIDPMGRYWQQPAVEEISINDTHAVMSDTTFKRLSEYSASCPSGVYAGKMWRRHDGAFDRKRKDPPVWLLCWYGEPADGMCQIERRIINCPAANPRADDVESQG